MSGCKYRAHYPGETCECETRLAAVTTHTRTSTNGNGPDYCAECSEAISEWVAWLCPNRQRGRDFPPEPATPDDVETLFVDVLAGVRCEVSHGQIVGASCVNCQSWARHVGLPFWRPFLAAARREGADAALAPVEALREEWGWIKSDAPTPTRLDMYLNLGTAIVQGWDAAGGAS